VARAAGYFLHAQIEAGSLCPTTMTFASIPVLRSEEALYGLLRDKLFSRRHDPRDLPLEQKHSMLIGMGMTEKQGGSDVRSNTTAARPLNGSGRGAAYTLTGHKWFFSAPMCDAHMVLARTDNGLSCFFVPRWRPDGHKNGVLVQRLKDKLGNRSNSSSEVEFEDAYGVMVGDEGRGIPTIIEMANHTRLDCVIGSAGLMRHALVQAIHHARHRSAFGKYLAEQPLMRNVLADLALESEAATALALRLARAIDRSEHGQDADGFEAAMRRLLTPVAKFWICKRGAAFAQEAMECLGGNGYVESGGEGVMARIYREMPLNSIWEGAGNIMALDLLRGLRKGDAIAALAQELAPARGSAAALDRLADALPARIEAMATETEARRLAQDVALAVQAALLVQTAPPAVAAAFCASRLGGEWGQAFGTLGAGTDFDGVIARALPQ